MRYLLLLKRLLKKKSYIVMLLVAPLMALMLRTMSSADAGLLTIGVLVPGDDYSSQWLKNNLTDNPGSLRFIFYEDEQRLVKDVESQQLQEGWICPANLDETVSDMALKGRTKNKIEIVIRESGLTHMLSKEVLCSRIYPMIARKMAESFISEKVYGSSPTEEQVAHILDTYDNYGINGNLFEMGYIDEADTDEDLNYLMMPFRGILALWLLLLAVAASMYYLEDDANGLFIWWKTRVPMVRDFLYYGVIMLIPSVMVLVCLAYGGVFTSFKRELVGIVLYDFAVIMLANILRELLPSIKAFGIILPVLIMGSAILSPVFIDFKEGRALQKFSPTFHYLYCIHDGYYVQSLLLFGMILLIIWYLLHIIKHKSI